MGNACLETIHATGELEESVEDDQPLGFEWYRWYHQIDGGIGEHHAKGKQDAEYRARSTYGVELTYKEVS